MAEKEEPEIPTDTKEGAPESKIPSSDTQKTNLARAKNNNNTSLEDTKVSLEAIHNFEATIKRRTGPYTYLKHRYDFKNVDSAAKGVFKDVIRALFGCAPFVDKLRQVVSEPVATEFRKLIEIVAYNKKTNLDITNIYKKYTESIHGINSKAHLFREYGDIIRNLANLWKTSRFRKLFSITRTIMGYCVVCKKNGPFRTIDIVPYLVYKYQLIDPEYSLEDSLYAERLREKYTCTACGMITNYKVIITTGAPDIIMVVPPENMRWARRPETIILPCEETRTHHYTLASFIYKLPKENNRTGVGIYIDNNDIKYQATDAKNINITKDTLIHYNLLCYVKKAVFDNYTRVLE